MAVSTVNDRHAKAIVDMPARSDSLVFSGSQTFYFAIRDLFLQVPPENDVLGRLLCFAMRMCQLRIEKNRLTAH